MGVILSPLPPVVLPVTSRAVKRKFLSRFNKKNMNEVKVKKWSISSISTEEEDSGAFKQDIGQDNLMTCNESVV